MPSSKYPELNQRRNSPDPAHWSFMSRLDTQNFCAAPNAKRLLADILGSTVCTCFLKFATVTKLH